MELYKDQVYEFTYVRTYQTRNGVTFFEVNLDGESYNVYPRPFQLQNPPETLKCKVREIEENGYVKLTQDYEFIIESYFNKRNLYDFTIIGEDRIIDSGQIIYKVNNPDVDLDFYYLESDNKIYSPGDSIKCRISLKKDKEGKLRMRLYSSDRDMNGYRPEEIFASIEHSHLYEEYFENLIANTDDLEELFDEMIDKVENNNRLWIFDYIKLLKIKAGQFSLLDLNKAIDCNLLIIDFENWILESDFMSLFSPATRAENLLKAETTLSNAEIDIEAIKLIQENKQIDFIIELLSRLRSKKVIRKKESVYRKLFKILSIDQNLFDEHIKEIAEIISITNNEVMDVEYLDMIINKFNRVVQEKKKQLNLSIHYQREKEVDTKQLTSLVICLGILITIYQKDATTISDNRFNLKAAFTDLCKYLAFLTSPDKANKLINKALAYTVSENTSILLNGSKLIDIENSVEDFIDSILNIEIAPVTEILRSSKNEVQIQYTNNELFIIPTFKRVRAILQPHKVYNIPNTPIYICSIDSNFNTWNTDGDISYYKEQWSSLQDKSSIRMARPSENEEVIVKVKKENTQPYGVFCYINNVLSDEDGLISKYDYLNGLVDCDNMPVFFEAGLTLPARIHYNSKNQINLSVKEYLYELSYEIAEATKSHEIDAICLKKAGKDAWLITNNSMLCRAKLKMSHSVKEGGVYKVVCNDEKYEVPGVNIIGVSHKNLDALHLLQEQLRILSQNYEDIKEYNGASKGLPHILLIIDNYIRLTQDEAVRYNLYHIGRLISKVENSELANYYSARINYFDALHSFSYGSTSDISTLETNDDIANRFPSLKEQSDVLALLKTLGVESEIDYLFAVANNDDKSSLITKLSRLILAANIVASYNAPEQIIESIKRFIISELGAYSAIQSISESEEVHEEEIHQTTDYYYGTENQLQEFKTSVVYFAGDSTANPKEQFKVILKTITGFLNAKGGVLWLGVADNGHASGIEPDLHYFEANTDKYERIIRQEIVKALDKDINGTISFEFLENSGMTVCKITIPAYFRPVAYNDEFYLRQGNETRVISGNSLIMFIERRLLDKKQQQPQPVLTQTFEINTTDHKSNSEDNAERKVIEVSNDVSSAGLLAQESEEVAFINMYIDGCYTLTSFPIKDKTILFSEKIPTSNNASLSLLLCYNNGCVNRMSIPIILCKKYNYRYSNGLYKNADLMKAFIADESDYISVVSTALDKKYIKVYPISDISDHTSLGLKGNQVISQNFHSVEQWNIIESKYAGHVEKLIYSSRSGIGKNILSRYYAEEMEWLNKYFKGNREFSEKNISDNVTSAAKVATQDDILLQAITSRSKEGIKEFLVGCEGDNIHRYRETLIETIQKTEISGEDFWFLAESFMEEMPSIFRRPITIIAQSLKEQELYKGRVAVITKVCNLFLEDTSKYSQSLEFIETIKDIIPVGIKTKLVDNVQHINTFEGFNSLFRILGSNIDQKVYILSLCNSIASYYSLYDTLNKYERKYGVTGVKSIRNIERVLNSLRSTTEGYITYKLILKTIFHKEDIMPDNDVHQFLLGGFETFNKALMKIKSKNEHNELLKSIGDYIHTRVSVKVQHIFNNVAICNARAGLKAILPLSYMSTPIAVGDLLTCFVGKVDYKDKVLLLCENHLQECVQRNYNLVSVGDKLEVRFNIQNNSAVATVIGCSPLRATVERYPKNFDFRKKYRAVVTNVTSYNSCIINRLEEI